MRRSGFMVHAALQSTLGRPMATSRCAKKSTSFCTASQGKKSELVPDTLNQELDGQIAEAQELLSKLTRNAGDADAEASALPAVYDHGVSTRRVLTEEEKACYHRDGFVKCSGWFSAEEIQLLRRTVERDLEIDEQRISVSDAQGRDTKLTLWWYLGDDTYGQFGRSASLVGAVSKLIGGDEPYHSHTKVLLKEPRSGGAWEWHQDFGYWYSQGLLHPDKIVNAVIAIDPNTTENGCMRLLRRSHTLGRLDHGTFGGQAGADPRRVLAAMSIPGYDVVNLLLSPGDVAFFHSNTLHASSPNDSEHWRRNMICAYNSRLNQPLVGSPEGQPMFNEIEVVSDENILKVGICGLNPAANKMLK